MFRPVCNECNIRVTDVDMGEHKPLFVDMEKSVGPGHVVTVVLTL